MRHFSGAQSHTCLLSLLQAGSAEHSPTASPPRSPAVSHFPLFSPPEERRKNSAGQGIFSSSFPRPKLRFPVQLGAGLGLPSPQRGAGLPLGTEQMDAAGRLRIHTLLLAARIRALRPRGPATHLGRTAPLPPRGPGRARALREEPCGPPTAAELGPRCSAEPPRGPGPALCLRGAASPRPRALPPGEPPAALPAPALGAGTGRAPRPAAGCTRPLPAPAPPRARQVPDVRRRPQRPGRARFPPAAAPQL